MPTGQPTPSFTPTPRPERWGGRVDFYPNLLVSVLALTAPAALPVGHSAYASAPPLKSPVQCFQQHNTLITGIPLAGSGLPPGQLYDCLPAPAVKYQPKVDVYPDNSGRLLITATHPPFLPQVWPSTPSIPKSMTADMYVVAYIPAAIPTTGVKPALFMQVPTLKYQVFVEPIQNTLIRGIPAQPAAPISNTRDTSQLQTKYNVYDTPVPNALIPNVKPLPPSYPFISNLTYNKILSVDVIDHGYLANTGRILLGIPPVPPPTPPGGLGGVSRTGGRVILDPKKAGETLPEVFNFISRVGLAETIVSASCVCSVYSGTDPNPSAVTVGGIVISGTTVTQTVAGGLVGVIYELLTKAVTNLGNIIEMSGYLSIIPDLQ
jgi:hypothetical protein